MNSRGLVQPNIARLAIESEQTRGNVSVIRQRVKDRNMVTKKQLSKMLKRLERQNVLNWSATEIVMRWGKVELLKKLLRMYTK